MKQKMKEFDSFDTFCLYQPIFKHLEASLVSGWFIANFCLLTVGFGDALQLVLLLDGVTVGRSFGGVDQFVSEAFGDGFDISEGGFPGAGDQEPNGLIHAAERRHVDGLTTDSSCSSNASGVFPRPAVNDSVRNDLQRVLAGKEMNDFEGVFDDTNGH